MDDWHEISFDELKKGMYVKYYSTPYTYESGQKSKGGLKSGGYVSMIENDFFGLINKYKKQWCVQKKYVEKIIISPKEYEKYFDKNKD